MRIPITSSSSRWKFRPEDTGIATAMQTFTNTIATNIYDKKVEAVVNAKKDEKLTDFVDVCMKNEDVYDNCGFFQNVSHSNQTRCIQAYCNDAVTSNVYTKQETEEKMSNVYKTFEKDFSRGINNIQTTISKQTDSLHSENTKVIQEISWIQIQQYITWVLIAIVGIILVFKSFDVSLEINNPIENQEIILEHKR